MSFKQILEDITPSIIKTKYTASKDSKQLDLIEAKPADTTNLRSKNDVQLKPIFESAELESMWNTSKKEIQTFRIPDSSGGVNPGDRKALYFLISSLKPSAVLEIGTHIGASTLHIAAALYLSQVKNGGSCSLTTVDIVDVNSTEKQPWLTYGTTASPVEMINRFNYGSFVKFVADTSIHFAANCQKKFDFVFLDGSHAASVVYQEIPMALNLLKPNGVILLHDYFPGMKPLWSDGAVIPGPYLAVERLVREGLDATVLPLGKLPWATKQGSNVTSLALLLKNS